MPNTVPTVDSLGRVRRRYATPEQRAEAGRLIRAERLARVWSQQDVAELVGCTQEAISLYERGVRMPVGEGRRRLERVLGLTPGALHAGPTAVNRPTPHTVK